MRQLLTNEEALKHSYPGIGRSSPEGIYITGSLVIKEDSPLLDQYIKTNYSTVTGNFQLESDTLISLEGCPKEVEETCEIRMKTGTKLTSFEGCPQKVGVIFKYLDIINDYHSLEGICRSAYTFKVYADGLTSYHNVHKYIDEFSLFDMTPHVSDCLLGFLLVKKPGTLIKSAYNKKPLELAVDIINKHLKLDKDVLECQEELLENGLKQFAKL